MKIQESGENYLEAILMLHNRNGFVRSVDVAKELGFTKPSVSHAMGILKQAGHIVMEEHTNQILLTDSGREIAERIYERHCVLTNYLIGLGVTPETAKIDACKMEHDLSEETYMKMKGQQDS